MKTFICLSVLFFSILVATNSILAQTAWFKYEGNPVIKRGPVGTWDNAAVYPSRVIREDTLYRMWYTGSNGSFYRTGHATSTDGIHWTKSPENPVMSEGPEAWESGGAEEPYILGTAEGYKMWYMGEDNAENWRIGYATSTDGINWVKSTQANPIIGSGAWDQRGPHHPSVDLGDKYEMWFQGDPIEHHHFQIGYATASDETTWTVREQPVFSWGNPGAWDDDKVFCPRVFHFSWDVRILYGMYYCGERNDGRTQIGFATSYDGIKWERFNKNPVLQRGPEAWDLQDIYALDVLYEDNIFRMWYGGMDVFGGLPHAVGYAVSPWGLEYQISAAEEVLLKVSVYNPVGLKFTARILSAGTPIQMVQLFDDGMHGDRFATDGIFANNWTPPAAAIYTVDLVLTLNDTLNFEMKNAATGLVTSLTGERLTTPRQFNLAQNYPNPFNPSTTIKYALPFESSVDITIYNMIGQRIEEFKEVAKEAGYHDVIWQPKDLSSGVYFYSINAKSMDGKKNYVKTLKMLYMK